MGTPNYDLNQFINYNGEWTDGCLKELARITLENQEKLDKILNKI